MIKWSDLKDFEKNGVGFEIFVIWLIFLTLPPNFGIFIKLFGRFLEFF